jgi:hypothetical protein
VQVLQLGELVEPVDADAPLEGFPALLQGGVVGLALHRQQVLEGTALPGRGM